MTPPTTRFASGAPAAHPRRRIRRGTAPRVPRRVSGPARPPRREPVVSSGGALALPKLPRLPLPSLDGRVLDRLLTGRLWIGFVGFALIGIVFMQVSLLKLNAGIGHAVEQAQSLERVNADLRAEVSQLGSNDRIQQVAERLGLELPPPGAVTFLGKDGRRMGGDGLTALAVGTQTGSAAAGTAAGATVPGATTTTTPAGQQPTATTATTPAATPASTAAGASAPSPTATAPTTTTTTAPTQQQQTTPPTTPPPAQRTAPTTGTTPAGGATAPTG
jgi:cell division protein FtsL